MYPNMNRVVISGIVTFLYVNTTSSRNVYLISMSPFLAAANISGFLWSFLSAWVPRFTLNILFLQVWFPSLLVPLASVEPTIDILLWFSCWWYGLCCWEKVLSCTLVGIMLERPLMKFARALFCCFLLCRIISEVTSKMNTRNGIVSPQSSQMSIIFIYDVLGSWDKMLWCNVYMTSIAVKETIIVASKCSSLINKSTSEIRNKQRVGK